MHRVGSGGHWVATRGHRVSEAGHRVGTGGHRVSFTGQNVSPEGHLVRCTGHLVASCGHIVGRRGQRVGFGGQTVGTRGQCVAIRGDTVCMPPASGAKFSLPPMACDSSAANVPADWLKSMADGCRSPRAIVRVRANSGESAGSSPAKARGPASTKLASNADARMILVAFV
jgi:hypothetical protein